MIERTLSIIKPDGTARHLIGRIISCFEEQGLKVAAMRMCHLSLPEAENFYHVHRARPFFQELVTYMCSGPVVISVLEGEDAIALHRRIMGATDPTQAEEGTIRALYGQSIGANTVHGSDSSETAKFEINYFFAGSEICVSD